MNHHLLVVEDEERVADFVTRGLRAEGYTVSLGRTGPEGFELARAGSFAAIILDLLLPGMSGLEVCQSVRATGDVTPILMLTALDAVEDRVEGLRLGADDYLTKPFAFDELIARIEALIRRNRSFKIDPTRVEVGDLVFDRETLAVTRAGRPIAVTAKELALLELLMSTPGKVFSRARILSNVWGYSADPLTNIVDVYVRRLRKKLDDEDATLIVTLRGVGYKLEKGNGPESEDTASP